MRILDAKHNFLGIPQGKDWSRARMAVLPLPLESTTTFMKGTGLGPEALLEASRQVELYDDELEKDPWTEGITTITFPNPSRMGIEKALDRIQDQVSTILDQGKRLAVVGGEHSLTIGVLQAYLARHADLSVLHLDAHTDLREEYEGSRYNHACVMARVAESFPFVSVGVRSFCREEADRIRQESLPVFTIHAMNRDVSWMDQSLKRLGERVYITLDLDVLDPAVMPAVGTPEPGGLGWYPMLAYLKRVFAEKQVVGMDMVELCPRPGAEYGVFAAAKLLYRMIGYWMQKA